mmetsp:Transcript_11803/g.18137  ORF Transcript_11803/g.18137 Transcript_11803/m.18137 type:complete len:120 (-) Transcript_11803:1952-2311(-)
MDMEEILNHPVVVEVLNLVYEGQYSINTPTLYLSHTFQTFFSSSIFDKQSLTHKILQNITNNGEASEKKQSSLQFNIWKYNLEQRLLDEVLFTFLTCSGLLFYIYTMMQTQTAFLLFMK